MALKKLKILCSVLLTFSLAQSFGQNTAVAQSIVPFPQNTAQPVQFSNATKSKTNTTKWSPKRVDWRVVMNQDLDTEKNICTIHWQYDDHLDLSFNSNSAGTYYFNAEQKDSGKTNKMDLFNVDSRTSSAILVVDGFQNKLNVGATTSNNIIVTLPNTLNNLSYLQDSNTLVLTTAATAYHLPLENAEENFRVFQDCQSRTPNPTTQGVEKSAQKTTANLDNKIDTLMGKYPPKLDKVPLTNQDIKQNIPPHSGRVNNAELDNDAIAPAPIPPTPTLQKPITAPIKNYSDDEKTILIKNLTRKLALLEKEKEELRKKLLSTENGGVLNDLVACEPVSMTPPKAEVDALIIQEYKNTIRILRDENDLLLEDVESCK